MIVKDNQKNQINEEICYVHLRKVSIPEKCPFSHIIP